MTLLLVWAVGSTQIHVGQSRLINQVAWLCQGLLTRPLLSGMFRRRRYCHGWATLTMLLWAGKNSVLSRNWLVIIHYQSDSKLERCGKYADLPQVTMLAHLQSKATRRSFDAFSIHLILWNEILAEVLASGRMNVWLAGWRVVGRSCLPLEMRKVWSGHGIGGKKVPPQSSACTRSTSLTWHIGDQTPVLQLSVVMDASASMTWNPARSVIFCFVKCPLNLLHHGVTAVFGCWLMASRRSNCISLRCWRVTCMILHCKAAYMILLDALPYSVDSEPWLIITCVAQVRAMSAGDADDELTSLAVLKAGKKVICGSQTGVLNIFSWGDFSGYSDRFPGKKVFYSKFASSSMHSPMYLASVMSDKVCKLSSRISSSGWLSHPSADSALTITISEALDWLLVGHPNSVDAIVKVDEDTVITGSSDGVLRILSVQPHALMGILGQHDEFGCETIALSHDHRMLASTSFGPAVRLWDTSCLDENAESPDAQVTETVLPVKFSLPFGNVLSLNFFLSHNSSAFVRKVLTFYSGFAAHHL